MLTGPLGDPAVLPNPVNPSVAVQPEPLDDQMDAGDADGVVEDASPTEAPATAE